MAKLSFMMPRDRGYFFSRIGPAGLDRTTTSMHKYLLFASLDFSLNDCKLVTILINGSIFVLNEKVDSRFSFILQALNLENWSLIANLRFLVVDIVDDKHCMLAFHELGGRDMVNGCLPSDSFDTFIFALLLSNRANLAHRWCRLAW